MTEGEVAEAFHMSALRQLPIVWLVQDNEWDISTQFRGAFWRCNHLCQGIPRNRSPVC